MTALPRIAAALLIFLVTLLPARSASAAPKWVEADEHFRHGVQLFKENDFSAALVEFLRAYEIDPKYQVLYNIGEAYYQLQDYANALKTLERYLAEGSGKIGAARKKTVEEEITTLKTRVATLTVTTNEPGARITIDDILVGSTPLDPLTVSAGRRKVTATLSGRVPVTQVINLAGGDKKSLEIEIAPLEKTTIIERGGGSSAAPEPPSVVPAVVLWSATSVLAGTSVVTGILALGASKDLEVELARFPGDADALASAKSTAFGLGLATDILIGTSIAAAGVAVYFTVDWATAADPTKPDQKTPKKPAPTARVKVLPGGLALDGTF